MKNREIYNCILIFIPLLFIGCYSDNYYNFKLKNNLNDTIKIIFRSDIKTHLYEKNFLLAGEEIQLYSFKEAAGFNGVEDEKFKDSIWVFTYLRVYKSVNILSTKAYKNRNEWIYKKNSKREAIYTTVIDSADF